MTSTASPSPPAHRRVGVRTESWVHRVIALGFLPAALVFGLLGLRLFVEQWSDFVPLWSLFAATGVFVVPVVMGSVAPFASVRTLRALAAAAVTMTVTAQAALPFAIRVPTGEAPWLQEMIAVGIIASTLAWRPVTSIGVVALSAALVGIDRVALGASALVGAQDGLYVLLFCVTTVALAANALSFSQALDRADAQAIEATAATEVRRAREREQSRINALVHDRVLATLLLAARGGETPSESTRRDAAAALEGLSALLDARPGTDLSAEDFVFGIQTATTDLLADAGFGYDVERGAIRVPFEVAEALTQAVEEALRNVQRHAGSAANCTVHVHVGARRVLVDVLDDGLGFDRDEVPSNRLGIAHSIEGRVRELVGGAATVISEPGTGTRVLLRFEPQDLA